MSQYTSYYLYQKYEKRGDQPWLPSYPNVYSVDGDGTMPLVVKMEDDPACGYVPPVEPIYRWIDLDPTQDWMCEDCGVFKVSGTYNSGQTFSRACNNNPVLTSGDTSGLTNLEYVKVGDCCTSIGASALQARPVLVGVTLPSTITSIGAAAFSGDSALEDCVIPSGVTTIGAYAFNNCVALRNIILWDSITSIGDYAFVNCDSLVNVNIPSGITSIPRACFEDCSALLEVTIPDNIESIDDRAFYHCTGLTSITCLATTPPALGNDPFDNTSECPIFVPSASLETYKSDTGFWVYKSRLRPIT